MAQKTVAYTTGVTPGSYTSANVTVDSQGLITAIAGGTAGVTNGDYGISDYNPSWKAWSFPPYLASQGANVTNGQLVGVSLKMQAATSISSVTMNVTTNTATYISGQNFLGLYQAGNLIATTGDISAALQGSGTGVKTFNFVGAPIAVTAGNLYVAKLFNKSAGALTTSIGPNVSTHLGMVSIGQTDPNIRNWENNGGFTALPGTMPAQTPSGGPLWFALS